VSFQKDGPQRFVLPVIRLGGLGKELPATAVIHDETSWKMSVDFRAKNQGMLSSNSTGVDPNRRKTRRKRPGCRHGPEFDPPGASADSPEID